VAGAGATAALAGVAVFLAARKADVRHAKARPPWRLAAGGWCMVEHASSISAYPSQPFTDVRHISLVAGTGSWISSCLKRTGIDGADAVTFNLTECYFLITVPSFGGFLRNGVLSVVFYKSRDLSML
jgi:hypothetical protein